MNILNYTQYSHWLPNWLFKLMAGFYIDYKYPRHIYIETTTKCTLKCTHCPRPKIEEDMEWDIFNKIINESSKYGPRSFSLHGFGEPTMDEFLSLKMRLIKTLNKKNNIILTTNGLQIDYNAYNLADKIIITYRPPYNLDKYKPWKHKIMIRNFMDVPVPGTWRCENKQYHNFGGNVKSNLLTSTKRYPCYHLWLSPMIAWNGDMLICCNDAKHRSADNKDTIAEFWNGKFIKYLREEQLQGRYHGICRDCDVWSNYKSII